MSDSENRKDRFRVSPEAPAAFKDKKQPEEIKPELNDSIEAIKDDKSMPRVEGVRKLAQIQEERKLNENAPEDKTSSRLAPNITEQAEKKP